MFRLRFALLAGLLLAAPALAAPVPIEPKDDGKAWVKALPADTDGLFVVDVKAFMASPLVKKGLMGKLPPILRDHFLVPVSLKSLGLDPMKDLKSLNIAFARSEWNGPDGKPLVNGGGGVFIFQTTKTSATLQSGIDTAAKDATKGVKAVAGAKGKVYEAKAPGKPAFLAVLPGGALVFSPNQRSVEAALAQVRGAKVALKNAEISKFVKGLKPGAMVSGLLLPTAVVGASSSSVCGAAPTVKLMTLADSGFQGVRVEVKVKDALKGFVELECKDAADATKKGKEARTGLEQIKPILEMQAAAKAELKAVVEVLKKVTIKETGKVLRIEAEVGPDAVKALEMIPLTGPG